MISQSFRIFYWKIRFLQMLCRLLPGKYREKSSPNQKYFSMILLDSQEMVYDANAKNVWKSFEFEEEKYGRS